MKNFNFIVGKSVEDAKKIITKPYYIIVTKEDGESFYITMQYDPHRIHVTVEKGIITEITGLS